MSRFWRQALGVAKRDLLVEGRAGEGIGIVLPFGALAIFVVPLATSGSASLLADLAAPVYWLVTLLFGMQLALRQTATETVPQRRLLVLLGLDPVARFVGRTLSASLLLLGLQLVLIPLVILFYEPEPVPAPVRVLPALVLYAVGLAMLGTLAGDLTVGLRTRTALAPMLAAPLAVPLVMGASQSLISVSQGDGILTWTLLLVATDLALAVAGVVTARPLEETAT